MTGSLSLADLAAYDFLSPNSQTFADYWISLPRDALVPDRQAFDPAAQRRILDHFVILEIVAADRILFRLAGTAEVERYGREVTGMNYLDFVDPERRPRAAEAFLHMADRPCGMLAVIHSTTRSGQKVVNEAIGFPMRDREGRTSLLYFQSNTVTQPGFRDPRQDRLDRHVRVSQRRFIDIGAGVPDDFSD